jgi:aryl-alcohol dehydrogenase-like predicted oxidoreductase
MERRRLGRNGPEVSAIGLGCAGMSMSYGVPDDVESVATIHRALDLGVTLFNTSDAYGAGVNEELLGRALRGRRHQAVVMTKFGNLRRARPTPGGLSGGHPDRIPRDCEASLRRLGVERLDVYALHRVDPAVAIEETVGAMARLVEAGKVGHLALSEAGPATLRRAHRIHPIAALETEYSLWTRDAEAEILPTCRELGIGYVAYAPLGRGFLTGTIRDLAGLVATDRRREHPRFLPENLRRNVALLEPLQAVAAARGATPGQVALAGLLSRGPDIVPIPGTKRRRYLEENAAAPGLRLAPEELARLDRAFPPGAAAGPRYPEVQLPAMGI